MDLQTVLNERYSVRKFSSKKVEQQKINAILEAARIAPTAKNNQPQRIFVMQSDEALQKFRQCTKCHFNAPLGFVICYDKRESWKSVFGGHEFGDVDASIVTTYMMLEAQNQGLGTTWVGLFDPKNVGNVLGLDENLVPVALLPTGYASDDCEPGPRHGERKPLSETVTIL